MRFYYRTGRRSGISISGWTALIVLPLVFAWWMFSFAVLAAWYVLVLITFGMARLIKHRDRKATVVAVEPERRSWRWGSGFEGYDYTGRHRAPTLGTIETAITVENYFGPQLRALMATDPLYNDPAFADEGASF
jgi:hypothetical protein